MAHLSRETVVRALLVALAALLAGIDASGTWKSVLLSLVAIVAVLDYVLSKREQAASAAAEDERRKIKVEVLVDPARVILPVDVSARIEEWMKKERAACLASLDEQRPPFNRATNPMLNLDALPSPAGGFQAGESVTLEDLERLEARQDAGEHLTDEEEETLAQARAQIRQATRPLSSLFENPSYRSSILNMTSTPDQRTPDQYKAQVERYLAEGQQVLRQTVKWAEIKSGRGLVEFRLRNLADRTFEQVEVEVYIPGQVAAGNPEKVRKPSSLPSRPRPFGERIPMSDFGPRFQIPGNHLRLPPAPDFGPIIDNSASARIAFRGVNLRPSSTVLLDTLHFVTDLPVGSVLHGKWTATATNADGRVTGSVEFVVDAAKATADEVLSVLSEDDEE